MSPNTTCTNCWTEHDRTVEMAYSHTAPRPDGYALVYECPECGETKAFTQTSDDDSDYRTRPAR